MKRTFLPHYLLLLVFTFSIISADAQTQKGTDINGKAAGEELGFSVSMANANTVAIGAPYSNTSIGNRSGLVRVYAWADSIWKQLGNDILGQAALDYFGLSVSMPDANTVAIGAPSNDNSGSNAGNVRVFVWNGSAWIQKGSEIDGEAAEDRSGASISMPDANTIAIGAPGNDGNGNYSGQVRIYTWNGSTWIQKGSDLDGEAPQNGSGEAVSMPDANTVAIGAPNNNFKGNYAGQVRVYAWDTTINNWKQKGIDIDGEAALDFAGSSVSMPNSNTIAVGVKKYADFPDANGARVYTWNDSIWQKKGIDIAGRGSNKNLGASTYVAVDMPNPSTIAIGVVNNDASGDRTDHVSVFNWKGNEWVQNGTDIKGEAGFDWPGYSVSMPDPGTVALGSPFNDNGGNSSGQVRVFTVFSCTNTTSEISPVVCDTYTSPSGKYTWVNTGFYKDTIPNALGCDSIISVNLKVYKSTQSTLTVSGCYSYTSPSGKYTWTVGGTYQDTIPTINGCDSVLTLLVSIHTNTDSTIEVRACHSYTSPSGKYIWSTTGTYLDTISNANGCDSLLTIDLFIYSIDTSVIVHGAVLTAAAVFVDYQWIDCVNGFDPIPGANQESFAPDKNGTYAVILHSSVCTDTSACVEVTSVSNKSAEIPSYSIYPNPSKGQVTVSLDKIYPELSIIIRDINGRAIQRIISKNKKDILLSLDVNKGLYFIQIIEENNQLLIHKISIN